MMICAVTGKQCEHAGCIGTGCIKQTGAAVVDWSKMFAVTTGTSSPAFPTTSPREIIEKLVEALKAYDCADECRVDFATFNLAEQALATAAQWLKENP